ncbi:MAG: phosphate butyryltransferase, partial [Chloroflexi bacterium]|nr:phosphate butyryltransferase [Chloroflexota bacterium]
MSISSFEQLLESAKSLGRKKIAIAAAQEAEVLLAASDAEQRGFADCTLVGNAPAIERIAAEQGVDLSQMAVIHEPEPRLAARKAMELVSTGQAHLAMKGSVETGQFLRAALDKDLGLRVGRLLSHVGIFEIPGVDRLLFISDAGVVVAPTMEMKIEIVYNAIEVAQALGIEQPKVAILAATEMVNPKIPNTLDAANLAKMADRGQIKGGIIDGPLALDNAISVESARVKGIQSAVAGHADILIV